MTAWDELRAMLVDISFRHPHALMEYPDPAASSNRQAPFTIVLAAWASDVAAELDTRFGENVVLTVGAMPFPLSAGRPLGSSWPEDTRKPASSAGLTVELEGPLVVRSGHSVAHRVAVSNQSGIQVRLRTNGHLQSAVVDESGRTVGRYVGAQRLPGVRFLVEAGETTLVPVLVGTTSLRPELGFSVPPGQWHLRVDLDVEGAEDAASARGTRRGEAALKLRSDPLPMTVIDEAAAASHASTGS